jgi:hypothetical protein
MLAMNNLSHDYAVCRHREILQQAERERMVHRMESIRRNRSPRGGWLLLLGLIPLLVVAFSLR